MGNFTPYDEKMLLERIVDDSDTNRPFLFVIGSGLTTPRHAYRGVDNVATIVSSIADRIEDRFPQPAADLREELIADPAGAYRSAFRHLTGAKGHDFIAKFLREITLNARTQPDPVEHLVGALLNEADHNKIQTYCAELEQDFGHWSLRPGLRSLGRLVVNCRGLFSNRVLTTNFDPLIEVAVRQAGGQAVKYVLPADGEPEMAPPPHEAIQVIHVHGDWSGVYSLHSDAVLRAERPRLESFLSHLFHRYTPIFLGCGAWEDVLTKTVESVIQEPTRSPQILWGAFGSAESLAKVPFFARLSPLMFSRLVPYVGVDADSLLNEIDHRLRRRPVTARPPVHAVPSGQSDDDDDWQRRIEHFSTLCRSSSLEVVDAISPERAAITTKPNFIIAESPSQCVMVVVPEDATVDLKLLGTLTRPNQRFELASADTLARLGFSNRTVHPFISPSNDGVQKIYVDVSLLAQAMWFPTSWLALPIYADPSAPRNLTMHLYPGLDALAKLWAPNYRVAALARWRRRSQHVGAVLGRLLESRPIRTRFAPTPSNRLHLGNARVALASYLVSLRREENKFRLRFDNTNPQTSRDDLIPLIREELRWIGLEWDEKDEFQQAHMTPLYQRVRDLFERRKLLHLTNGRPEDPDGSMDEVQDSAAGYALPMYPPEHYFNLWFTWRTGAQVNHQPPLRRLNNTDARLGMKKTIPRGFAPREVRLFRAAHGTSPFYRLAGLVDDVRSFDDEQAITYVVRDRRQVPLTEEQAHIRWYLEEVRRKLQLWQADEAGDFSAAQINPWAPISLPVYLHLQIVCNAQGEYLRKREGPIAVTDDGNRPPPDRRQEIYTLRYLRDGARLLPDSVAGYLVATFVPPRASVEWHEHLRWVGKIFGQVGFPAFAYFAERLDFDYLVTGKNILVNIEDIYRVERSVLESLPVWRLRQLLEAQDCAIDIETIVRLRASIKAFRNWGQIRAVVARPTTLGSISAPLQSLLAAVADASDDRFVSRLKVRLQALREQARKSDSARQERAAILAELRLLLTGAKGSPPIEDILSILDPTEAAVRLRAR